MAQQYDVVTARTSAFANLIQSMDKLLEPSEAEKEAQKLTNDIRRMQMQMQMQKSMVDQETAMNNLEMDSEYARGMDNLQAYNKATTPQQRMGFSLIGNIVKGPLWKPAQPGETTRHILNPNRWTKGAHQVNPVLMAQIGLTVWGGAYLGLFRGSLYLGSRILGTNTARKMLAPSFFKHATSTNMNPAFANSAYVKALDFLNKGGVAKAAAHQKYLVGALKSQAYANALKAGVAIEGGRRGFSMIDGNPSTTFLSPNSVYAKNPYAGSGNSYFDPSVIKNVSDDINGPGGLREAFDKVKKNHEQGYAMDVTARQLSRKLQEIAYMYPSSLDPDNPSVGDYISWELYNNMKDKDTVYVNDTPYIVNQLRDIYDTDKIQVGAMLTWLQSNGYLGSSSKKY